MPFSDFRPVYKSKNVAKAFQYAIYFFVKYTNDCAICLSFIEDPKLLPCGHCYCNECITKLIEYGNSCPKCGAFFWIYKPVKFFFVEEVQNSILLRRCNSLEMKNAHDESFFSQPYPLEYFQDPNDNSNHVEYFPVSKHQMKNYDFYQIMDGQLYFLDPKIVRGYKTKPKYSLK